MIILGTNSIKDTGFNVANSLRFNDGSSDNLSRSTGTPSSRQKFTFSTWIKLSSVSGNRSIFNIETDGNTTLFFMVKNGDQLHFVDYNSGAEQAKLTTNALHRDPSAWYHVVLRLDSTQGTNTDRCRLYVNGSEVTSFSATVYPSQNYNFTNNVGNTRIGVSQGDANYWDGYMAETVYCDNQSLDPTSFGEFDEDSPTIWKPIDVSGLTFGNEGFYLDFENASSLGADVSGNGNNFTVNNLTSIDQSTDTCTNNFCTFNPLIPNTSITYSEGNLQVVSTSGGDYKAAVGTIGVNTGKWYCEFKASSGFDGSDKGCGIYRLDNTYGATTGLGNYTSGTTWSYAANGNVRTNNGTVDTETTFTNGDIIGIAIDLDNNKLYFAKNNTWINSGDPTSGSTGTGAYAIVAGDFYTFAATVIEDGANDPVWQANFGSPPYSVSSGNSDGNGIGNFEYAVPSGYFALNTKNLAEFG
jgi:hypothetical protein